MSLWSVCVHTCNIYTSGPSCLTFELVMFVCFQVRCLKDHGEFEIDDGTVILLKKNSQVRTETIRKNQAAGTTVITASLYENTGTNTLMLSSAELQLWILGTDELLGSSKTSRIQTVIVRNTDVKHVSERVREKPNWTVFIFYCYCTDTSSAETLEWFMLWLCLSRILRD